MVRIRDLPIRVGSAATTPGFSVFWVMKWIVIAWNPRLRKDCGECIAISWGNILAGLMCLFYDTELWSSEQKFNTLRPECHLPNNLFPKFQSLDVYVRYLVGVMYFGRIQAALSHFYEFMWFMDFDVMGVAWRQTTHNSSRSVLDLTFSWRCDWGYSFFSGIWRHIIHQKNGVLLLSRSVGSTFVSSPLSLS
jgi:hypothetical protein